MSNKTIPLIQLVDRVTGSCVKLAPQRGAIVTSFSVADRELLYMDESTLIDPSKNVRGGIPVLFPSPGKLLDDTWHCAGKTGAMKQHGFARTLPWEVVTQSESAVSLQLKSNAFTLAQYPWRFTAQMHLSLHGTSLQMDTTIRNDDSTDMPFALGFHPYFVVADKSKASIPTNATRCFNNVSKRIEDFSGFDFAQAELDVHLLDHNGPGVLNLGDARIVISSSDEFGMWVVWSLADKKFICLEPWTAPGNALNSGEGLLRLESGTSKTLSMTINVDQS